VPLLEQILRQLFWVGLALASSAVRLPGELSWAFLVCVSLQLEATLVSSLASSWVSASFCRISTTQTETAEKATHHPHSELGSLRFWTMVQVHRSYSPVVA
jgi:hypothetical protein